MMSTLTTTTRFSPTFAKVSSSERQHYVLIIHPIFSAINSLGKCDPSRRRDGHEDSEDRIQRTDLKSNHTLNRSFLDIFIVVMTTISRVALITSFIFSIMISSTALSDLFFVTMFQK